MDVPALPRMTLPVQLVLRSLLADPAAEKYGLEIGTDVGLPSGTIHPILARLEGIGWLESRWEDGSPRPGPRRRYYRFTDDGTGRARKALERASYRRRKKAG